MTYKDFTIGQSVMCKVGITDVTSRNYINHQKVSPSFEFYLDNGHLIPGNWYVITDVDWHFPDKICIKSSNGLTEMFCPIVFFDIVSVERERKINEILNNK